jgi:hypothetical protein
MGSGTFVKDFREGLEFAPVEGCPNVYSIHPRREIGPKEAELSAEEWDKFEQDVADAFERTPDGRTHRLHR